MKRWMLAGVFGLLLMPAYAQSVRGTVYSEAGKPLPGARLESGQHVHFSDSSGKFRMDIPAGSRILVSAAGFGTDSVQAGADSVLFIFLKPVRTTATAKVTGRNEGPFTVEVINTQELRKAACCDLAGCFETQTTVQPQTTNVITNAKELRILGLSGVYNQLLVDGMPLLQGLTYTYGISSYPGPAIRSISISKGTTSILQGPEGISGQINVNILEPSLQDRLFVNAYVNSFGERHLNVLVAGKYKRWSHGFTAHIVRPAVEVDRDKDRLTDLPRLRRYMFMEKIRYGKEGQFGWHALFQLRYLHEEKVGGQLGYNPRTDAGQNRVYGQWTRFSQPELVAKLGYRVNADLAFQLVTSEVYHRQDTWFGLTHYNAWQWLNYTQVMADWFYKPLQNIKAGITYRHLVNREDVTLLPGGAYRNIAGIYRKQEQVGGVFAEHQWQNRTRKWMWLLGIRADYLSGWGWMATPRTSLKWEPGTRFTFRGSIGRGWRTVNLFSENINILASNRSLQLLQPLQPEIAWNSGLHGTFRFSRRNWEGSLALDAYYTWFERQFFPDYESVPGQVMVTNFNGRSTGKAAQAELQGTWKKKLTLKAGYTFLEVERAGEGLLPFNPRHKVMTALSWKTFKDKLQLDMNAHWFGPQRLPSTELFPEAYRQPAWSPGYTVANLQFTWFYKRWEFYGGVENLFNFRQWKPVAGWEDPFGAWFDPSFVWGPTRGREIYLGLRYTLPQKKK